MPQTLAEAQAAGVQRFLTKPFSLDALKQMLDQTASVAAAG